GTCSSSCMSTIPPARTRSRKCLRISREGWGRGLRRVAAVLVPEHLEHPKAAGDPENARVVVPERQAEEDHLIPGDTLDRPLSTRELGDDPPARERAQVRMREAVVADRANRPPEADEPRPPD